VDPAPLQGVKVNGHISIETYFRILTPSYVNDVDTVLYLDADLLVCHSLLDLWREPLDGSHLLAVPHASKRSAWSAFFSSPGGVPSYSVLGIPGSTQTFNAGVMILDVERWRQTDVTTSVIAYLQKYCAQVLWWDQDGLNAVLHSQWRPLPPKWNVMTSTFASVGGWKDSILDAETFDSVRRDPAIIHYCSSSKPWMPAYSGPFLEPWQQAFAAIAPHFGGSGGSYCNTGKGLLAESSGPL
jgi:lipopolysaccharide biosynthesis glycosyltransferase